MSWNPHRRLSRRTAITSAGFGAVGAVALAGCTSEAQEEDPWELLGTIPQPVRDAPGVAMDELPPGPVVETPDSAAEVTDAALHPALTKEQLDELFSEGSPPHGGLTAPEGTVYLITRFHEEYLGDQRWPSDGDVETGRRILFTDHEGTRRRLDLDPEQRQERWMLQVPAGAAPEDAVLEIEIGGKIRQLSLIDGSRVRDDLSYLEGRPRGLSVRTEVPEHEPLVTTEAVDEDGGTDTASLSPGDGMLYPVSAERGWPAEGTLFAVLTVHHHQTYTPSEDYMYGRRRPEEMRLPSHPEGCTLTLPDGTVVPQLAPEAKLPLRVVGGVFTGSSHRVWFEVPVGIESATVQLRLALCPRRAGLTEALDLDPGAEVALAFTDEQEL